MVDPARVVALEVGIDDVLVIEGEQERVAGVDVAALAGIDFLVGAARALVFDDALALGDRLDGEYAVAMDGGATGGDLARHAESGNDERADILARIGRITPSRWPVRADQRVDVGHLPMCTNDEDHDPAALPSLPCFPWPPASSATSG